MEQSYLNTKRLVACGTTDVGQSRKANEDFMGYRQVPNGDLFVVCDGMGGHVGGATASKIAVDSILDFLSKERYTDIPEAIAQALIFSNVQVLGKANDDPSLKGMGTTACIVLIDDNGDAWTAHVGDSRIYLFDGQDRHLHRISKDQSLVQSMVDSGQLDDRDAEEHPQKNVILSALGLKDDLYMEVEKEPLRLIKGDIVMICSDGLSGMVDDSVMESILSSKDSLKKKSNALMGLANAPDKGKDNITIQLVQVCTGKACERKYPDFNPKWRIEQISGSDNDSSVPFWRKWLTPVLMLLAVIAIILCIVFGIKNQKDKGKDDIVPASGTVITNTVQQVNSEESNKNITPQTDSKSTPKKASKRNSKKKK